MGFRGCPRTASDEYAIERQPIRSRSPSSRAEANLVRSYSDPLQMLTANQISTPGFGKDALFEVTGSGLPIGAINDTRGTFELNKQTLRIVRSGFLAPRYQLNCDETPLALASRKPFVNSYTLSFGDKEWTFKATVLLATSFGLFEGETRVGSISSGPFSNRLTNITADLPDALPLEVQMFLLSLFIRHLTSAGT